MLERVTRIVTEAPEGNGPRRVSSRKTQARRPDTTRGMTPSSVATTAPHSCGSEDLGPKRCREPA
jgi:hypothetical protein